VESAEQQLGQVAEGDCVLAVDKLAGAQFDDVAKEDVHVAGGSQVAGGVEKFLGESLLIRLGPCGLPEVMGTQGILVRSSKHAAALAARADVLTLLMRIRLF
jgi:hypothetical protein